MMMAGKNQAALAVCAQTKVIFPFNMTPNAYLYFNIAIFIKCNNDVIMMSSSHVHQAIVRSKLITISIIAI